MLSTWDAMYLIIGDSSLISFGFSSFFQLDVILSLVIETSVLIFSSSGVLSLLQVGEVCWWNIDPCDKFLRHLVRYIKY